MKADQLAKLLLLLGMIIFIPGAGKANATLHGTINHKSENSGQLADNPGFYCCGGENRFEITPGESASLQLSLADAHIYNGFQADITLPAGLSLIHSDVNADITLGEEYIHSSHIIAAARTGTGDTYRVVVYSVKNESFVDGENLLALGLSAAEDFEGGEITVSNTILTLTDDTDRRFDPITILAVAYIPPVPIPFPDDFSLNPAVSRTKLREGSVLGLSAAIPEYGYVDGWTCEWTERDVALSNLPEYELTVKMAPGDSRLTETRVFTFHALNYSPEDEIWAQFTENAPEVTVYRAPQPLRDLMIKGDGSSRVLIAMSTLSDEELMQRDYRFVFGYDDADGERHIVSSSNKRYARYDDRIFSDNSLRKWCYTEWDYADGSTVSSGLRYLDGDTDEAFDASVFAGEGKPQKASEREQTWALYKDAGTWTLDVTADSETCIEIFTTMGHLIYKRVIPCGNVVSINLDSLNLDAGVNLVRISSGMASSSYKIYR